MPAMVSCGSPGLKSKPGMLDRECPSCPLAQARQNRLHRPRPRARSVWTLLPGALVTGVASGWS